MIAEPTTYQQSAYNPGKSIVEFGRDNHFVRVLVGGRGCVHPETRIFDPTDGSNATASERAACEADFHVWSLTIRGPEIHRASAPFVKGSTRLLSIEHEGSSNPLRVAPEHKLLTPRGWVSAGYCGAGALVAFAQDLPASTSDSDPSVSLEDALYYSGIIVDCQDRSTRALSRGERPLPKTGADQASFPSRDDARARSQSDSHSDDRVPSAKHNRRDQRSGLHSKNRWLPTFSPCLVAGAADFWADASAHPSSSEVAELTQRRRRNAERHQACSTVFYTCGLPHPEAGQLIQACAKDIRWVRISKTISDEASDYYDLHVPGAGNYLAEGCWHKNSGKTYGVLMEDCIPHLFYNAGGKVVFMRKTETSQAGSTIETMSQCFTDLGELYQDNGGLFKSWNDGRTVRVPSQMAVDKFNEALPKLKTQADVDRWIDQEGSRYCGFIEMQGLPHVSISDSKLRGAECSRMIFIEADQIDRRSFELAFACLRWKGADPATCDANGFIKDTGIVLDTNPPSPHHWIAKLEEQESAKPEAEREMRFWHIATYENEHNLPPDYIRRQILLPYAKNPAMIERMLWGRYAEAFDGSAVYYNFDPILHVGEDLPWPKGAYLIRGWDFGTCNAVVWLAMWTEGKTEYLHALAEQYIEGSDTDRQARETVKLTEREFPFWNDRTVCAGILDYIDPAGASSNYSISHNSAGQKIGSCADILRTHGIRPGTMLWQRGIQKGIALINRFLEKRDATGAPCFKVDAKNCPLLKAALSGGYRYAKEGEAGFGGDEPLKGTAHQEFDFSHIADSFRYPALNVLRLLKEEFEESKKPLFRKDTGNLNPVREI